MTELRARTWKTTGMRLVKRPVPRVSAEAGLREGSTGRVIAMPAARPRLVPKPAPHSVVVPKVWAVGEERQPAVELAFYRKYTEAMLRRYLRMSMAAGRVPSLLGRELFRGNVTHYRVTNFEDVVIFCHDMEKLLNGMAPLDRELIRRVALQQYSHGEAAGAMGMSLAQLKRVYNTALDRLTEQLLAVRLLEALQSCQGGNQG